MTIHGAWQESPKDVPAHTDRLAEACRKEGLIADVLGPASVKAYVPTAHAHLAEIIKIKPDDNGTLSLYWSWDERICSADELDTAVASIKHVVTPAARSAF